jgi:hypothetical protein
MKKNKSKTLETNPSNIQKITNFLKEFAGLIIAMAALLSAIAIWFGKSEGNNIILFPTGTPESYCINYKSGNLVYELTANTGLQDIAILPTQDVLTGPFFLELHRTNGEIAGLIQFAHNKDNNEFILKSIVDRYCYEVPQTEQNRIESIPAPNGDFVKIILSDEKIYKLKLFLEDNIIKAEFIEESN